MDNLENLYLNKVKAYDTWLTKNLDANNAEKVKFLFQSVIEIVDSKIKTETSIYNFARDLSSVVSTWEQNGTAWAQINYAFHSGVRITDGENKGNIENAPTMTTSPISIKLDFVKKAELYVSRADFSTEPKILDFFRRAVADTIKKVKNLVTRSGWLRFDALATPLGTIAKTATNAEIQFSVTRDVNAKLMQYYSEKMSIDGLDQEQIILVAGDVAYASLQARLAQATFTNDAGFQRYIGSNNQYLILGQYQVWHDRFAPANKLFIATTMSFGNGCYIYHSGIDGDTAMLPSYYYAMHFKVNSEGGDQVLPESIFSYEVEPLVDAPSPVTPRSGSVSESSNSASTAEAKAKVEAEAKAKAIAEKEKAEAEAKAKAEKVGK